MPHLSEAWGMNTDAATAEMELAKAMGRARLLVLVGAFASFLFSVSLWFYGMRDEGLFVGLWVPSILGLGNLMLSSRK
ncbi:MAG: hypothetical protein ACI91B_003397 [Planctomycetota bacterium]|jgi:hypothetical protein